MRWKTIDGWENYAVSDTGLVMQKTNNPVRQGRRAGIIPQGDASMGYMQVQLIDGNKRKYFYVHQLVAKAFIPNPNDLPKVNHKDGNKSNNHYSNLEWCTQKQNIHHALQNGLHVYSKKHTENRAVAEQLIKEGYNARTIKNLTSYSITHISRLKSAMRSNS
jgi:HNH endonuclease/NUMOD4 motif